MKYLLSLRKRLESWRDEVRYDLNGIKRDFTGIERERRLVHWQTIETTLTGVLAILNDELFSEIHVLKAQLEELGYKVTGISLKKNNELEPF